MTLTVPGLQKADKAPISLKDQEATDADVESEAPESPKLSPEEMEKKLLNDEDDPLTKEELDDKIELMKEAAKIEEGFKTWNEYKEAGNLAFNKHQHQLALRWFTKGLAYAAEDPTDEGRRGRSILHSNRSAVCTKLGKYKLALSDANRCLKLAPGFVKGYARKGLAHFNLGEYVQARESYKAGLDLDPDNAPLRQGIQDCETLIKDVKRKSDAGKGKKPAVKVKKTWGRYIKQLFNPLDLSLGNWFIYSTILVLLIASFMGGMAVWKKNAREAGKSEL